MFLQVFNHKHYGKRAYVYLEFLPQILFFWSIFGYLVLLIIMKWMTFYENTSEAPGLLDTLIYMFLSPGTIKMPMYRGQAFVQVFLLIIAFISIPWMLLGKPYYELYEHKRTVLAGYAPTAPPPNSQGSDLLMESGQFVGEVGHEVDEHGEDGHEVVQCIRRLLIFPI